MSSAHRNGEPTSSSSSSLTDRSSPVVEGASLGRPLHRSVSGCDGGGGALPPGGNNRRLISAAASDDFDGTGNPETFQTGPRNSGTAGRNNGNGGVVAEIPHNVPVEDDDDEGGVASLALSEAPRVAAAAVVGGSTTGATTAVAANETVMDVSTDAVSQDEREDDDDDDEKHAVEDEDESDYDYDYEDDDDQHFTGFLLPADVQNEPAASHSHSSSSSAAVASGGANVIDPDAPPSVVSDAPRGAESGGSSGPNLAVASSSTASSSSAGEQRGGGRWREPSRDAVSMSLRAESEKTGGRRRLASDLYKIMMGDTTEQGFSMEPSEEDSMDRWTIKLFGFDGDSNLSRDLAALGLDHVELEMSFPDDYPFEPPFVRVVRPRFKRQTGFVMNGALCMELLTTDGWNPVNDIESVIVSIRSLLVVGDGRLAAAADLPETKARVAPSKKKAAAAVARVGKAKKGAAAARDEDVAMMQEGAEDGDVGGGKRQRVSDGKPAAAAAAAAAAADSEDDVDRMDEEDDDDDGGDSPRPKGRKKRPSAKISSAEIGSYSAAEARAAYSHLSDYHKKKGWDSSGWWARKG